MARRLLSVWLSSCDSTFQEVTALDNESDQRFRKNRQWSVENHLVDPIDSKGQSGRGQAIQTLIKTKQAPSAPPQVQALEIGIGLADLNSSLGPRTCGGAL